MGARTRSKAGKDHRGDVELLGIYRRGRLTHGLRRRFISACRNASARAEVIELMTHNAKGEIVDLYTTWQWPTLCKVMECLPSAANVLGTSEAPSTLHPANGGTEVVEAVGIKQVAVRLRDR